MTTPRPESVEDLPESDRTFTAVHIILPPPAFLLRSDDASKALRQALGYLHEAYLRIYNSTPLEPGDTFTIHAPYPLAQQESMLAYRQAQWDKANPADPMPADLPEKVLDTLDPTKIGGSQ